MATHVLRAGGDDLSTARIRNTIRIGVLAGEPIRLEGLASVFDQKPLKDEAQLVPVVGALDALVSNESIDYLVVDLHSSADRLHLLDDIRTGRPDLKLIVIGPEGNDALIMDAIIAGARAYLDTTASPRTVREAINVVIAGSIWAPRRLLSLLIDRLLSGAEGGLASGFPRLTARERQVLDLILLARSNREIATELGIEERTVKAHVGRLMRKTGAENRIELSMRAVHGAVSPQRRRQARRHVSVI